MSGSVPEPEVDSRTASVGSAQTRGNKAGKRSLQNSHLTKNARKVGESSSSIPADDNSSQSSSDATDTDEDQLTGPTHSNSQIPNGGIQPSVSWNKSDRGAIRTKLRPSGDGGSANAPGNSFDEVNSTYWRRRGASLSSSDDHNRLANQQPDLQKGNDAQVRPPIVIDSSSGSEAGEITEGEDTMVLNMGSAGQAGEALNAGYRAELAEDKGAHGDQDEENVENGSQKNLTPNGTGGTHGPMSAHGLKEAAVCALNDKYRFDPQTLADLHREDFELQAKYIFYNVAIDMLDLCRPITCTECFKEGHLADVCPNKECVHCGAWAAHESRFCPTWRRCQKCRERGHDEVDCSSSLRELSSEVPCDFCSSTQHTESDCDMTWKLPAPQTKDGSIFISVSCAYCTSTQHLIGDCPRRHSAMNSSSWTLRTYDPSKISSLPSLRELNHGNPATKLDAPQYAIRGRAAERISSPDSDDALSRFGHSAPTKRGRANGHIRFETGIGRGRGSGNGYDRQPSGRSDTFAPDDSRRPYRERDQYFGHNTRQRSVSPRPYSSGRGARGSRQLRRSPTYEREPPGSRGRSRGRGAPATRGRGRQRSPPDSDTYRPMPSAGKKAWSKFRS